MTKVELLAAIRQLESRCKNLTDKVSKRDDKLNSQSGAWQFLFDTDDVSTLYIDSIENRTKLLRNTTLIFDDRVVHNQVRLFPDGNRVDVIHVVSRLDKSHHKHKLSFFKRIELNDETVA